ncbi:MAG TPA: penicillin-binding protein 1C [Myxococcales bacterium]|nr:penicillin-binding protein 1C [Myxococcales bacterium]
MSLVWGLPTSLPSPRPSTLILDRHGTYLGEVPGDGDARGYWPLPAELPARLVRATLETEDRHFYAHGGVWLPSVARALWQDVRNLRLVSGASTIAMQVARLAAPGRRGVWRKLREAIAAEWLVWRFGHDAVLRSYLTLAPYGNRAQGAVRAARLYFGEPVQDLSWLQAAYLAGLPQAPGRENPYDPAGLRRGLARAHRILATLHARGFVGDAELREALRDELGLVPLPHRPPDATHAALAWGRLVRAGPRASTVSATLDLDVQSVAAAALRRRLDQLSPELEGAALVVDRASGDVLAYVGSRDYFDENGRGAIDYVRTKRSPGSALKPFIYALAMERGQLTAATLLADTRLDIQTAGRAAYLPENSGHGFLGPLLAREALGNSRNIPALRVLSRLGVEPALRFLDAAGVAGVSFEPDRYGLGLAIGNLPVTLEELVTAYALLAHHGETAPLRWTLADAVPAAPRRLLRADVADMIAEILADPLARRPSFPRGGSLDFPYAVSIKTGTSQGGRDAWAVGFSDRLLIGVWIGSPDWDRQVALSGSSAAAPALHEMLDALMRTDRPWVPEEKTVPFPAGWVTREVCPLSGELAGPDCDAAVVEAFAPGTEPTTLCPFHARVRLDRRNGLRAGPGCSDADVVTRRMLTLPHRFARWARSHHLELAPERSSPLCPLPPEAATPYVRIEEPRDQSRFLRDPDGPTPGVSLKVAADVEPANEDIVWIVDGRPVARAAYPYDAQFPLSAGEHVIRAVMARRSIASAPVTVFVQD